MECKINDEELFNIVCKYNFENITELEFFNFIEKYNISSDDFLEMVIKKELINNKQKYEHLLLLINKTKEDLEKLKSSVKTATTIRDLICENISSKAINIGKFLGYDFHYLDEYIYDTHFNNTNLSMLSLDDIENI